MWDIDYSTGTKVVAVTWTPDSENDTVPSRLAFVTRARARWGANSTLRFLDITPQRSGAVIARYYRTIND